MGMFTKKDQYKGVTEKRNGYERRRIQVVFKDKSRTFQEFKNDADINNIMKKYKPKDLFSLLAARGAPQTFADWSDVPDYREAAEIVLSVQEHFMSLPSDVRKKFDNDPESFIRFMSDEKNSDEAYRLGLAQKPVKTDSQALGEAIQGLRDDLKASKPSAEDPSKGGKP